MITSTKWTLKYKTFHTVPQLGQIVSKKWNNPTPRLKFPRSVFRCETLDLIEQRSDYRVTTAKIYKKI